MDRQNYWLVALFILVAFAGCQENPADVTIIQQDTTIVCPAPHVDTVFAPTDTVVRFWWCFAHGGDGEWPPHWECEERDSPPPDSFP